MSARRLIHEILGAVNIWLDRKGKSYMVHGGHAEFAAKTTGINFLKHGQDSNKYWYEQGQAYQQMFKNGWIRVSIFGPERRIQVDFRGSINRKQYEWLADEAFERKSAVVDDSGHVYLDFRDDRQESVAHWVVHRIVEDEVDPKDFAMGDEPTNFEASWIHLEGPEVNEEVPVAMYENGWVMVDAAYGLAWVVDEETYARITDGFMDALSKGVTSGEIEGFKWHFYSEPEPEGPPIIKLGDQTISPAPEA